MILVTGATGHLGKLALQHLLTTQPASSIAALVRDPAKATDLQALGVELRTGDYFDYPSLVQAFAGVDTLLLVSSGSLENRVAQHTNAINAARENQVQHVVYTSMVNAAEDMKFLTGSDHYHTEQLLKQSGLGYTILRNTFYTEALLGLLGPAVSNGQWYYPGEGATLSLAARADLAEALARVGLDPAAHHNQSYSLTGSQAYTFPELAAEVSEAAGKPVAYVPISLADFQSALLVAGVPAPFVPLVVSVAEAQQAGQMGLVDEALPRLLGRAPQPLATTLPALLHTPANQE
jgi:NAD(P)H dehydrogenase (quinone)